MNQDYIIPNSWSIIEEGFKPENIKSSESIFSLGNGAMGQRANFEEYYRGDTFQGSYIAGVYYPDKTRVEWWKNGYPEYFAKVLNAPSWIGINVVVNDVILDLNTCKSISNFRRELNMKEGWLSRSFTATLKNDVEISVKSQRFLSITQEEIGAIKYQISPLNCDARISFEPFLDGNIVNQDKNWDDKFWNILSIFSEESSAFLEAETMKTRFKTCTFMHNQCTLNGARVHPIFLEKNQHQKIDHIYQMSVDKGSTFTIEKIGGYISDRKHNNVLKDAKSAIEIASKKGFKILLEEQAQAWAKIWQMADITIEGDIKAQQGIRFNIFHLNQTYSGNDPLLNIGPKGFTGEKYGGSTYWDTEAYCLPFYMATKSPNVAKNLLEYRFQHLEKAIENAQKAYDEALESYNKGVDKAAELQQAEEELEELQLAAKSETFSPTNAYASKTPIIVGSYINDVGSAVVLNSPLYNISSIGIEVVFQVDATDQETVSLGDSVEIELPTDERVPTVITFIDQVVTQTQAGEFIEVTLEVLNPEEIEAYDQAPVKVFVTTEISKDVLYVPVNALLALAEGGYALEIYDGEVDGGTFNGESGVDTSYVAVEIGVFTDGFVEVKGNISEGQIVVVPR